jgi:NAD-dependent deacetylase
MMSTERHETQEGIRKLRNWLAESSFTVVLTGAGMSTESGIPDFRSRSGWWRNIDPTTVATVDALRHQYELFHAFYSARVKALEGIEPHQGHRILAKWEDQGLIRSVATQNVDGLHHMAGSHKVYELHGSILTFRCADCRCPATQQAFLEKEGCKQCGGHLRPNVVLFDEMLPMDALMRAEADIRRAELVIVIGSSLNVYPAAHLPSLTNGKTALINMEPTRLDAQFDLAIYGKAGEVLREMDEGEARL